MTCGDLATAIAACCMFLQPLDDDTSIETEEAQEISQMKQDKRPDGWTRVRYVADTGAERSVFRNGLVADRQPQPSAASKQGRNFTGPDGGEIAN